MKIRKKILAAYINEIVEKEYKSKDGNVIKQSHGSYLKYLMPNVAEEDLFHYMTSNCELTDSEAQDVLDNVIRMTVSGGKFDGYDGPQFGGFDYNTGEEWDNAEIQQRLINFNKVKQRLKVDKGIKKSQVQSPPRKPIQKQALQPVSSGREVIQYIFDSLDGIDFINIFCDYSVIDNASRKFKQESYRGKSAYVNIFIDESLNISFSIYANPNTKDFAITQAEQFISHTINKGEFNFAESQSSISRVINSFGKPHKTYKSGMTQTKSQYKEPQHMPVAYAFK